MLEQTKAIQELRDLDTYPYPISVIEWWLMKHTELRKASEIDRTCICGNCYSTCICFKEPCECYYDMPSVCGLWSDKNNAYRSFRDAFDNLDKLVQLHKYENYFKNELAQYSDICNDVIKVQEWMQKSELLVDEKFSTFFMYNQEETKLYENALELTIFDSDGSFKLYVNRHDFINILNFLELFNHLFNVKKVLPESLGKISSKME